MEPKDTHASLADAPEAEPTPQPDAKDTGDPQKIDDTEPAKRDTRTAIVNVLEHTYGPWIVVLVFFVALRLDPSIEVLIGFLLDWQNNDTGNSETTWSTVAAFLALASLPIAAHASAFVALRFCGIRERVESWVLAGLPIVCLLGYAWAFLVVTQQNEANSLNDFGVFWFWCAIAVPTPFYLFVFAQFDQLLGQINLMINQKETALKAVRAVSPGLARLSGWLFFLKPPESFRNDAVRGFTVIFLGVAALLVVAIYVGLFDPEKAKLVGPVGLVACFGIIACIVFSALTAWSSWMPGNTPLILLFPVFGFAVGSARMAAGATIALLVAAFFSKKYGKERAKIGVRVFGGSAILTAVYTAGFFFVEDCKTLAGCNMMRGAAPAAIASGSDAVPQFTDIEATKNALPGSQDGPIRIVAAQGGGLYAAYHTAYYLAKRADTETGFTDSVYAISGVSGGSVGAGVYWAIRNSNVCETPHSPDQGLTCHQDAVDAILRRDYLTPSVATFLFRDLFDTFFPVSALLEFLGKGPIDRGHMLEDEVQRAVQEWRQANGVMDGDPLGLSITDSALVTNAVAHPLLFLNGTRVDNGTKVVVSPISTLQGQTANLRTADGNDLTVLNGMVVSARFPIVTPPARVAIQEERWNKKLGSTELGRHTIQLVDGGYFDNSGIETALDIILDLYPHTTRQIKLIVFSSQEPQDEIDMHGTLGAPLTAFAGAWRARRFQSEARVANVTHALAEKISFQRCQAEADANEVNYTVSWYLSSATFETIKQQIKTGQIPETC